MRTIIGLAGQRGIGKTLIAKHLCENHGFKSVHPFDVWKDGIKAMMVSIGVEDELAEAMVRGNMKDTPDPALPDGHDPRYLMERLGKFAGTDLGPQWTLGLALKKMNRDFPDTNLVIESIVYEVDVVREFGGHIVMVNRPGVQAMGLDTDKATALIVPDSSFLNDGHDLDVLHMEFDGHMARHNLNPSMTDILEPS